MTTSVSTNVAMARRSFSELHNTAHMEHGSDVGELTSGRSEVHRRAC